MIKAVNASCIPQSHNPDVCLCVEDTLWTVDDAIRKLKLQDVKGKIWSQEMQLDITANALNLVDLESGVSSLDIRSLLPYYA